METIPEGYDVQNQLALTAGCLPLADTSTTPILGLSEHHEEGQKDSKS